jgi:putative DNA primase/helicase
VSGDGEVELMRIRSVSFTGVFDTTPTPFADTWNDLVGRLRQHEERTEKGGPLWSPVSYCRHANGSLAARGNTNVHAVTCFVADLDGAALADSTLAGVAWHAHSTWSHTADDPHFHLVVPLAAPIARCEWTRCWAEIAERLGVEPDPQTKDAARMFYLPQHHPDREAIVLGGEGAPLAVAAATADEEPPVVATRQPRSRRHSRRVLRLPTDADVVWEPQSTALMVPLPSVFGGR